MFKGTRKFNRDNRNGKGHVKIFPAEGNHSITKGALFALTHPSKISGMSLIEQGDTPHRVNQIQCNLNLLLCFTLMVNPSWTHLP